MKVVNSTTARWFGLAGRENDCQIDVHEDLVNDIWVRAKSLFSSKAGRAPRQKSDPWWSGLFNRQDGVTKFDPEQSTAPCGQLPLPLTVQDVLRRGALAMQGNRSQMHGPRLAEKDS
jgi:hypothetical protein